MATIEGNEIALRSVASELIPPVRNGQDARTDQDVFGTPFLTVEYVIANDYSIIDPSTGLRQYQVSFAPAWVYGFVLEPSWAGAAERSTKGAGNEAPKFFAAFGTAQASNEVQIQPGKVLSFPRGARRIYLRSDSPYDVYRVRVTWIVDRFATIGNSGADGVASVRTWFGDGVEDGLSINAQQLAPTVLADLRGYTNACVMISNNSNVALTYELLIQSETIDTGTVPANDFRLISYGPGVGTLAGKMVGHGIVLPNLGTNYFVVYTTAPGTGSINYSWRGY